MLSRLETPGMIQSYTESQLERRKKQKTRAFWTCLVQNTWYSAEKSTQAAGLETRTKRSVTPTWLEALTFTHSSTFHLLLSLFWPLSSGASPLCPRLFTAFLFLSPHVPFLFLPPPRSASLSRPLPGCFDVSSYLLSHTTCSVLSQT